MSHLQAPARNGLPNSFFGNASLEDHRGRARLRCRPVGRSLVLLRCPAASPLDADATQHTQAATIAGAATLPNPLPPHLLDHAHPLAFGFSYALPHHGACSMRDDHRLLAQPASSRFALLRAG